MGKATAGGAPKPKAGAAAKARPPEAVPDPRAARTERLARGHAVLKDFRNEAADRARPGESLEKEPEDRVSPRIRREERAAAIDRAATRDRPAEVVAVELQLAELDERVRQTCPTDLREVVASGLLALDRDVLMALLKLRDGTLVAGVRSRLAAQV